MFYIGCHLSCAKGFLAMEKNAEKIGATTFQFLQGIPEAETPERWMKKTLRLF